MIELQVSGMSCGNCIKAVTHAIRRKLPQATVQVDLAGGRVRIDDVPASPAIEATIRAAIADEGYSVQSNA